MDSEPTNDRPDSEMTVPIPPRGLAMVALLGPGLVWCGEYIGSGEVILAPRAGAILGLMVLWAPVLATFAKFWIGFAGARYTVCTGEGMIDMMSRTPGPRNWVLWPVFAGQLASGAIATGALASAAGAFMHYFFPQIPQFWLGYLITFAVIAVVWGGGFDVIKVIMSVLVLVIIIGVFDVARVTWPGWSLVLKGLFGFQIPVVPEWAWSEPGVEPSAWREILPLLGWAAGGFASQVWYTYWVLGAGYGMAHGREYGQPADSMGLRRISSETANRIKGWCRVVRTDATLGMVVGVAVTVAFAIAGAGVLRPAQVAPDGAEVAFQLSRIFSDHWGVWGAHLYILAGLAALISTLVGQFAGWPRLLADCARILIPGVARHPWKTQFRAVLVLYALSNMVLVYAFQLKPVFLVQVGAILDGLILTPLQALSVGLVLYLVMPRFYSRDVARILKPSPIFACGLALAFIVFAYFCVFQIPRVLG
ncbi:MAG: Nramp family divalent metal transporter [bacterium]